MLGVRLYREIITKRSRTMLRCLDEYKCSYRSAVVVYIYWSSVLGQPLLEPNTVPEYTRKSR